MVQPLSLLCNSREYLFRPVWVAAAIGLSFLDLCLKCLKCFLKFFSFFVFLASGLLIIYVVNNQHNDIMMMIIIRDCCQGVRHPCLSWSWRLSSSRSLCSRSRSSSSSLLWGLSRILFSSCFSLFLSILIYVEKSVSSKLPRAPVLKGSPALKCSFDNFPEYFFLPVSAAVDPWLTEKREDRKKYYGWPKIIF